MGDTIALNYYDSLLRQSDVALLNVGQWLNDRLIGFAFEYFQNDVFSALADHVVFISPEVTQFIKLSGAEELPIFLEPLNLPSKDLVFLAVNDQEDMERAGGSHWSLLVYSRKLDACVHYDSASSNEHTARKLAKKISMFVNNTGSTSVKFIEGSLSQQTNSSDCGVYTVAVAELICEKVSAKMSISIPLEVDVAPSSITQKRDKMKSLIRNLYEKGYK